MIGFMRGSLYWSVLANTALDSTSSPLDKLPVSRQADLTAAIKQPATRWGVSMTFGQMQAIAEKYLRDHPELWDMDPQELIPQALIDACSSRKHVR